MSGTCLAGVLVGTNIFPVWPELHISDCSLSHHADHAFLPDLPDLSPILDQGLLMRQSAFAATVNLLPFGR